MITDEMLAAAAGEVSAAMCDSIPASEHAFSPGFEKRMAVLIRRGAHPVRRQVLRYVAAALIAAVTAFAGLYLLSPTVRAAVNGWVRTTFGSYIQYYSEDTTPPDVEYDYFLPEEFDGYTLLASETTEWEGFSIYANDMGQVLSFSYIRGTNDVSLFLMDIENHSYCGGLVGSLPADIYIAPSSEEGSIIVWHDPYDNVLFSICAFASKDELITFAEKIEKTEKISN